MTSKSRLIESLAKHLYRLPGVGPRMAERVAYHILKMSAEDADALCDTIKEVRAGVKTCRTCYNLTDTDPCSLCSDVSRETGVICAVEQPQDLTAIENSGSFKGRYHVLQGALSPLDGIGPDDLTIDELMKRLGREPVREVILATNTDIEGDATAIYLSKLIKQRNIRATRIAQGLPFGGELEYADHSTLMKAIEGRREI